MRVRANANVDSNPNTSPSPSPSPNSDSNPTPSRDLSVETLRLEEGEQADGLEVRHEGGLVADGDLVSRKLSVVKFHREIARGLVADGELCRQHAL